MLACWDLERQVLFISLEPRRVWGEPPQEDKDKDDLSCGFFSGSSTSKGKVCTVLVSHGSELSSSTFLCYLLLSHKLLPSLVTKTARSFLFLTVSQTGSGCSSTALLFCLLEWILVGVDLTLSLSLSLPEYFSYLSCYFNSAYHSS